MEYKDYYKILGVERGATQDQIKHSYRKLARKYHPDVSKEANAEEQFKAVQEAYEVLKDPKKREAYDQLGNQWQSGQEFRPPPNWNGQFEGFDNGGFGGGGFSDFFEAIFGGRTQRPRGGGRQPFAQRGSDQHAKISISLEEAFRGGSKTIQMEVPERKPNGQIGYNLKTLKINIPAGITTGQKMRLSKQGAPGSNQGPPGDLYLEIDIAPHKVFKLEGRDVYLSLPITPWEAALGAKITAPTLGGPVELKIAPGAQSGQKLRLKGRGLPGKPSSGDAYVELKILTPPAKTDSDKAIYEKMATEMPFNPRESLF